MYKLLILFTIALVSCGTAPQTDSCYGLVSKDLEECLLNQRSAPEQLPAFNRDFLPFSSRR